MRLHDLIVQTQAHCAVLAESRPRNGRKPYEIAAMARRALSRRDYARWFEETFGRDIAPDDMGLAGLLLAFGLGVYSHYPYKALAVPVEMGALLRGWKDPVSHPASVFHRLELGEASTVNLDFPDLSGFGAIVRVPTSVWQYLGAFVNERTDLSILTEILEGMSTRNSTILLVGTGALIPLVEKWQSDSQASPSLSGEFEGTGLYFYYRSVWN